MKRRILHPSMVFVVLNALVVVACARVPFEAGMYTPEIDTIPRFITTDFIDLSQIERISRYRSRAGHDYPDRFESDRSMKHYYKPFDSVGGTNDTIEVFSPVDGLITMIWDEGQRSNQVRIVSSSFPYITFVIFHVATSVSLGESVTAGQSIGFADVTSDNPDSPTSDLDIAVWTADGHAISYISLLADGVFDTYFARGATSRSDFVLTEDFRDSNPITEWNQDFENDWHSFP